MNPLARMMKHCAGTTMHSKPLAVIAVLVLVMIASLSIAGCTSSTNSNQTASSAPQAASTTATTGKQIVVAQGQQFSITLPQNQTTGSIWVPTYNASAISQKSGSGSGGTEVFTFQALKAGTTIIMFDARPLERGTSNAASTLNETLYTVIVR
jgi:predicted secreted protein